MRESFVLDDLFNDLKAAGLDVKYVEMNGVRSSNVKQIKSPKKKPAERID